MTNEEKSEKMFSEADYDQETAQKIIEGMERVREFTKKIKG